MAARHLKPSGATSYVACWKTAQVPRSSTTSPTVTIPLVADPVAVWACFGLPTRAILPRVCRVPAYNSYHYGKQTSSGFFVLRLAAAALESRAMLGYASVAKTPATVTNLPITVIMSVHVQESHRQGPVGAHSVRLEIRANLARPPPAVRAP